MAKKTSIGSIILATTSFIGGMAAGLLLAPRNGSKNRAWLTDQATELSDWMDHQRRTAAARTSKKINRLRNNMRRTVPNLYEATEHIELSDKDVFGV